MSLINKYGAVHLSDNLERHLSNAAEAIVDLTSTLTPEDARIFEGVAIGTLVTAFAERRLRRALATRRAERNCWSKAL